MRAKRAAALARRRDALTGVSVFPNLHEAEVAVVAVAEHKHSPPPQAGKAPMFAPLPAIRLAQPFEALRDASDRLLAATGARPKIFLANLGTPADFSARATFAKNFFEAGGIEPVGSESLDAPALAAAYKAAGTALVCLCSTDKVYEKQARCGSRGAQSGRSTAHLSRRPAGRAGGCLASGRGPIVHLRGLRRPGDTRKRVRYPWYRDRVTR